jgi:hypothetical protein
MNDEFFIGSCVRVIKDVIVGDHAGQSNLKGEEGIVTGVMYADNEIGYIVHFNDRAIPDGSFVGEALKYLGTPGVDAPYLSDYDIYPSGWPI